MLELAVPFADRQEIAGELEMNLASVSDSAEYYNTKFEGDANAVTGDAKIFADQIAELRSNDLSAQQANASNRHELIAKYKELYDEEANLERREQFENTLLMRLATGIFVREHRKRYQ